MTKFALYYLILEVFFCLCIQNVYSKAAIDDNRQSFQGSMFCEYYNEKCNNPDDHSIDQEKCKIDSEECVYTEGIKHFQCFVLWKVDNATKQPIIHMKGCFSSGEDCYKKNECVAKAHETRNGYLFCCCEGDYCNKRFESRKELSTERPVVNHPATKPGHTVFHILLFTCLALLLAFGIMFVVYYFLKTCKVNYHESPTQALLPTIPQSPTEDLGHIQLLEVKASGRFGSVWRAKRNDDEVAVKIFPVQDQQSWLAEQEIFKLPNMCHPDILEYIGVEKRGDHLHTEFWLVTAYHHRGSLCDYLKAHTVTWNEMGRIAESMARGLTHLHDVIPGPKGMEIKPAVAHRDFKSKNVLLKADMSACIADFGLALIFQPGKACGDTHGQVGTRRYMAPEVLEGAINFTLDAFLRIDMYACGLVLWELASRCSDQGIPCPEYKLPFEAEVGTHPTLEEMQEAVVTKKVRPAILDQWKQHPGLATMCNTMEECWDHDAEARLSASCVMERVSHLMRYDVQQSEGLILETNPKVSL